MSTARLDRSVALEMITGGVRNALSLRSAGAITGLIFAVLLAASYLSAPAMPIAGTPAGLLVAYVSANSDGLERSWFLACGPALFFGGWFLGVAGSTLWEAGVPRHLVSAGIASALLAGALLTAAGVTWGLFVYLAPQLGSDPLVLVLAESRHFAEGAVSFPVAAAAVALSLATWSSGRGWRAVSGLGFLAAGLQLASGFDDFVADGVTGPIGPLAFGLLMLWIGLFSVALTVGRGWFELSCGHSSNRRTVP
jgi:hypothetical protein